MFVQGHHNIRQNRRLGQIRLALQTYGADDDIVWQAALLGHARIGALQIGAVPPPSSALLGRISRQAFFNRIDSFGRAFCDWLTEQTGIHGEMPTTRHSPRSSRSVRLDSSLAS